MKTKFSLIAGLALLAASCSNDPEVLNPDEVTAPAPETLVPVTVHVNDFSISMTENDATSGQTRAAVLPENYSPVNAVMLAFYDAEGTEVYKTTQVKNEGTYTTFGQFTANLQVGTYTMVALGYAHFPGDQFTLTSPTQAGYSTERPRETFCLKQDVTVTAAAPLDLDVTLNRISAKLWIYSTDGRPAGATKIRTTFAKGGKTFNPSTGLSLTDAGFTQTNNPSTDVGATIGISCFPFLATDEETMNVTIEALDANLNVLFTKTIENVPFKRSYITTVSGPIFTANSSSVGMKLSTDWGEFDPITF